MENQFIPRLVDRDSLPLSFAQQRLWFLDQLEPDNPLYNVSTALRLRGKLNVELLRRSLDAIVARHEALRTTFIPQDGIPVQVIGACRPVDLRVIDLAQGSPFEREAKLRIALKEESRRTFNLSADLMLRAALARLDDDDHVLTLVMHHIASDGWSREILFHELAVLYRAFAEGKPDPLPRRPVQYADFAAWQRERLQGKILEDQLSYWKQRLAGAAILDLPTDHPRPAVQSLGGARQSFALPKALCDELKAFSRRERATLFMTLLSAFQVLLHRYTGQDDIVIGSPIAGRTRAEIEELIGLFINTLVLRGDLSGDPKFIELLARTREIALGAYENQELPFERLVEELHPERDPSRSPLFQVMFVLQNMPKTSLDLASVTATPLEIDSGTAKFDLTLSMTEAAGALAATFEYNTDLFEQATIQRMIGHFQTLLEGIVANPERRLSELPILTEPERHRLLIEWNDTKKYFPDDNCIHRLFEEQAERTPDAVAVVFENQQLTYRQLNARANQLAHYLKKRGVGPDVLVGICVERSPAMVTGLLATLKAGAAYLPLDPEYPKERLAFMLEDAGAPVVLTQERFSADLFGEEIHTIRVDADWEAIAAENAENLPRQDSAGNLAYVLYTSGSTGRPKGVQIPHRALTNFINSVRDAPGLASNDVLLAITTFCFDIATLELFLPLVVGARVVIAGRDAVTGGRQLIELITRSGATIMQATPATWRLLLDAGWPAGGRLKIITGGEPLTRELASQLLARCSSLWNGYGPTETTVYSSLYRVDTLERPISIGRPVPNTRIYILDSHFQPVPVGVPGELFIGGAGVARGYLKRPELTAEKFIRDPFSDDPESRLYRTGDLVRYLPDGSIDYLGRIDNQVKLRGFRIEPGEIESMLARHPGVREAVVLAREDAPGDKRLVAYVVARRESTATINDLRSFLKRMLPEYMVPSAFVLLDSLPLTPSGKIDRKDLPAPDRSRAGREEGYVAPRNPVEELIAGIWAEVLKLEKVGIQDNFFDLGGHSLLAARVVSRMRASLHFEFPLRALFEESTVSGLAEQVEAARRAARGAQAPPMVAVSREEGLPLSFAQQRLWFLDQLEPGSSAYNLPGSIRLKGPLHVAALDRSLNEIVRRHEALRTTFPTIDGEPVQKIAPSLPLTLTLVDLTDRPEDTRAGEAQRIVGEETRRPFDLSRGPLLRVKLIRLGEQDHVLVLILHHMVSDGWSMGVLYRELSALYGAFANDRPSPLSDLPIQYVDFAVWQREWLAGAVLESQLSYWKNQLAGVPAVLNLPTDRPRPALQSFRGARQSVELSKELSQGLHALSRQNNVTLFMTLLAAFQTLLQRYSGQDDIVVGAPVGNRNRTETENLIGMFVNTLVLRSDLSGEPTFTELLARVREVCLGAYAHQDIPFEKLVEEVHPERSLSHSPMFQVLFNMLNVDRQGAPFAELAAEPVGSYDAESKFDLTLYVRPDDRGIGLTLVFNTDLFDAARMQELLDQFTRLLEQIAAAPDRSIGGYSLVTERSRQLLPDPTAVLAAPDFLPVTREFLAWVEKSPEQKAVTQDGGFLTYGELSGIAGRIARTLVAHGITPGDVVAVAGPRSLGLIASIMGALMSGGVLLTIDRNLPANRQRLMIETGRAKCLLFVGDRRQEDGWLRRMPDLTILPISKNGRASVSTGAARDGISLPEISPDDPAYIFFTSGTTAVPKGVLGCHKGLSHFLAWQKSEFEIGPDDRCGQLTNLSFDVVLRDIFLPLVSGATLALPPEALDPASELALSWLDRENVTVFHGVPTLVQHWLGHIEDGTCLRRLRWAFLAGEPLLDTLVRKWRHALPQAGRIVNLYGPTETTLAKCFQVIPDKPFAGVQPVGKPLPQTQALVLNRNGGLCGVGEPGEIVIRTPFRTRGYINSSDEQAKRFSPNPFRADRGDVVYYTGDGGRYGTDGGLEILGRLDNQIKIRGVRIEPDEVAAILSQHPEVKACFVAARKPPDREPMLVAYVVPSTRNKVTASDLRAYIATHLAAAAVPAAVVFLEALPLSPNGKVNARDLPEPEIGRPESGFLAPRNATERSLAELWCEVLKLKEVGVLDNFFDLGGHSLMATQLVSRIRRNFELEIPLQVIFEQPTIAGLALYLLERQTKTLHRDQFHELLAELDGLSDAEAERQLLDLNRRPPNAPAEKPERASTVSPFYCPQVKSKFFGRRRCNLIILINERFDAASFEQVAGLVRKLDPTIDAVVVKDTASAEIVLPQRPTLTFSPALIRHRPRRSGRVFCGYPLSKSQEYEAMARANIAVPRWALLSEDEQADLSGFDDYVVRKPNYGGRSAEVVLVRRDRIKWKPITTKSAGTSDSMIVQRFIYTGDLPTCYRVNTLFGQVLYAMKYQANSERPKLPAATDLKSAVAQKGFTVSATAHGSFTELCFDEEVIRLGERAHAAFPNIPLLGFDIVREMPSGKLYVLEANAIGYTWTIADPTSAAWGVDTASQFDGLRKAAYILAEKTQQCAE